MPRRDGTGPMGMGPRMGRGAGHCGGQAAEAVAGRVGRGGGNQRGGHGRRNRFRATGLTGMQRAAMGAAAVAATTDASTADAEKQTLAIEVGAMQSQLDALRKRLAELG